MFAVKDGVNGAENQPGPGVSTQRCQCVREVNIDGARHFRLGLAQVNVGQGGSVDDDLRSDLAEEPGQLIALQRIADVPTQIVAAGAHSAARDRMNFPVTAGLAQHAPGHEALRSSHD